MRKLLILIGILLLLDIAYFAFINKGQLLSLTYPPILQEFSWDSGFLYIFLGLEGALAGFLLTYYKVLALQDKLKKQTRSVEKASVVAEESSDKVKSLQAKIDTLEMALKEVLKNK